MRQCTYIVLALSLAGCASAPAPVMPLPPPEPVVQIQKVEVPTPVPCVTAIPPAPVLSATPQALAALTPDSNGAWTGIALLKGDVAQLSADDDSLRDLLAGCAVLPKGM